MEIFRTAVGKDNLGYKLYILSLVTFNGDGLFFASDELQADKEVVLTAVKQYGESLRHSSRELRDDKQVVLEAVRQSGDALLYASNVLRSDKRCSYRRHVTEL